MRAAFFAETGGPEAIQIGEVEVPEPGPEEVRIAVRAASMNHLDLWIRRGIREKIVLPHIGGSDIAGTIDALGEGAGEIPRGTRVVVDPSLGYDWYDGSPRGKSLPRESFHIIGEHTPGGFAQYAVVPAANLVEIPGHLSFEDAAASGLAGVTAWRALLTRGGLRAGERVLVTGASGGVSTMAIQIARLAGAEVFAVTRGPDNVRRVRELGAHAAYDRLEAGHRTEMWRDTGGEGFDVILDSVGAATWDGNLRALKVQGRLVTYGATTGPRGEVDIRRIFWRQLSILGSTMGGPREFREVMGLVSRGKLAPVIHEVLPLERTREAHEALESGEVFGKLVIAP